MPTYARQSMQFLLGLISMQCMYYIAQAALEPFTLELHVHACICIYVYLNNPYSSLLPSFLYPAPLSLLPVTCPSLSPSSILPLSLSFLYPAPLSLLPVTCPCVCAADAIDENYGVVWQWCSMRRRGGREGRRRQWWHRTRMRGR